MNGTLDRIIACGVVAVLRADSSKELIDVSQALRDGGVVALEMTMTTPGALKVIEDAAAKMKDSIIGAGSVLDPETARAAILAGAEFIVGPTFHPGVVEMAKRYGKLVMPGAFAPTEILTAWQAGADLVKVFPASVGGPAYFKDVKGPLPQVRLMPTGGVDLTTAGNFIRAGACALGAGSAMIDKKAVTAGQFHVVAETARKFVEEVRKART